MPRANTTVTLPIANIAIANTMDDMVRRVQTIIDYLNQGSSGSNGSVSIGGPIPIDDISAQFNGSQTVFTLTSSSASVNVGSEYNLLISLDGTLQEPPDAFTATNDILTFTDPPYANTSFYGLLIASNGAVGGGGGSANAVWANTANTANNADYLDGQHGAYYTNASNLGTGTVPNARLSGFYSLMTANDATYAYGKGEGQLNVNAAQYVTGSVLLANNATYAFGKTEGNLNVNSALQANNANNLGTYAANSYLRPVAISTPSNGQALIYISANATWINGNVAGGSENTAFTDDGNSGTSKTIDWSNGVNHLLTLTGNCTLTFSNPTDGKRYALVVSSGAGGFAINFPANCAWGPGGQPLNSQSPSKQDLFSMLFVNSTGKFLMTYALGF